jgi:methylaspartate ammonia-lyase
MKIKNVVLAKGFGGYFWDDEAAMKAGAKPDGFTYRGKPLTRGFTSIRTPSHALCIEIIFENGQVAQGDCVSVQYGARSGRDPLFWTDHYLPFFKEKVIPFLEGWEISSFRKAAEDFDSKTIEGKRIHTAIRYGVTQAILHGIAQTKGLTMAQVIAEEYETKIASKPIAQLCQIDREWKDNTDKCILRRVPVFPHLQITSVDIFEELQEYIPWVRRRIHKLGDPEYKPTLHFDLYATLGLKYKCSIPNMLKWLQKIEKALSPYNIIIEEPIDMGSRDAQIDFMSELRTAKKEKGLNVVICADEWCNTLEDIRAFADAGAADMIQVKAPDLGGVQNVVDALLYCKAKGVKAYLGGSSCETAVSRRVMANVALATNADLLLASPGMGIDEGYTSTYNEMALTLARIEEHRKKQSPNA